MKVQTINIITILFFLFVTTQYYWDSNLGLLAMVAYLFLLIMFFILAIIGLYQIFKLYKENFKNLKRIVSITLQFAILLIVYIRPYGIIDFEEFEDTTILEAGREGGGNCNTKLKLFANNTFEEKERCFATSKITGKWEMRSDTIFFRNTQSGFMKNDFYQFATIVEPEMKESLATLLRFEDRSDTTGHKIWIIKNELEN